MKIDLDIIKKDTEYFLLPFSLKKEGFNPFNVYIVDEYTYIPINYILSYNNEQFFKVIDYSEVKIANILYTCPKIIALQDIPKGEYNINVEKAGFSLACLTLSDKGSVGQREDTSGKTISTILEKSLQISESKHFILPDKANKLQALVLNLAHIRQYDIIVTTGGTGIAPTDLTPEALLPLLNKRFNGFEQIMMTESYKKTPNALISRAFVGTIDKTFIIALPGSPKAVEENLNSILPALAHTLDKLHGSTVDCARL